MHRMNPSCVINDDGTYQESTGSIGGWEKCEMRTYLKENIVPLIPENIRSAIKEVTKTQLAWNTSGKTFTQTTKDDVWLPTEDEIENSYSSLLPNTEARKKYRKGTDTMWWTRKADRGSSGKAFRIVSSGSFAGMWVYNKYGVCLCFCT